LQKQTYPSIKFRLKGTEIESGTICFLVAGFDFFQKEFLISTKQIRKCLHRVIELWFYHQERDVFISWFDLILFYFFFAFVFARTATVSRRILKEHYQGELESDESENNLDDEEDSFETEDYSEPVQVTTTTATPSPHQVVDDGYLFKNLQPTGRPDYKRTGFLGKWIDWNAITSTDYLLLLEKMDLNGNHLQGLEMHLLYNNHIRSIFSFSNYPN